MTSNDTAALVRDIAQTEPAPELLALAKLAGGNRLLVVELVRGLIEEHGHAVAQDRARLADPRLPQRLRNAVDLLLCPVSSRCRNMLRLIALSGQLPLSHIAALLHEPIGALMSLICEAVDVGVLAGNVEELVFAHELTRRTLATQIPPIVARQLSEETIF